jgi:hypothetical protein
MMEAMTQITVRVPARLRPFIATKVKEGFESAESYLLTLLEAEQLHEAHANDLLKGMTKKETARLDAVVQERAKGPFETINPFDEGYWNGIKAEGRKRAKAK